MTNLVKQLRSWPAATGVWDLLEKAADRIEKLEAALVEISKLNNRRDRFSPEIDAMIYKALENNND